MMSDQEQKRMRKAAEKAVKGLKTCKDIVATLERRHIQGVPMDIWNCPLARYLSDAIGASVWVNAKALGVRLGFESMNVLTLPRHLQEFVRLFDQGSFPQLNECEDREREVHYD